MKITPMPRLLACIFLLFYWLFFFSEAGAQSIISRDKEETLITDWKDFIDEANGLEDRIDRICRVADHLRNIENNEPLADSLYKLALDEAEASFDENLIFKTNKAYLEDIPIGYENHHCVIACNRIVDVAESLGDRSKLFHAYLISCKACLNTSLCDDELHYASMAFATATANDNLEEIILAKLCMGEAMARQNNATEAFKNYLSARELMEEMDNVKKEALLFQFNGLLYTWHRNHYNYEKAYNFKSEQVKYIQAQDPIDSTILMRLNLDMTRLSMLRDPKISLVKDFDKILNFAERRNNLQLKNLTLSYFRTWLIESERFSDLRQLMLIRYPGELEDIKRNDEGWYYNIKAYLKEAENQPDSANYYFELAQEYALNSPNTSRKAHFFKRYGEFLARHGWSEDAIGKFERSFEISEEAEIHPYMIEASEKLENIYQNSGNYRMAYKYANIHDSLTGIKNEAFYRDNLTELEVLSQQRLDEIAAEKRLEAKREKHQRQYFLIVLIVVITSLLLVVVSSMPVPEWLIEMLAFFSVLSIFEYIILMMDKEIYKITEGEPIVIFLIKMAILSILFPLHHIIETNVTAYLKKHKLIRSPASFSFKRALAKLWPWLGEKKPGESHA